MSGDEFPSPRRPEVNTVETTEDLLPFARKIVNRPGMKSAYLTTGYGTVDEGDSVLLVHRSLHDERIVDALVEAFREKGVEVDVLEIDIGLDEERPTTADVELAITEETRDVAIYSEFLGRFPWVEDVAAAQGYDLLIESTAGPFQWKGHLTGEPYFAERIPWQSPEIFASEATLFPQEVLHKIVDKTREIIHTFGPGSEVRITDPEGTDFRFTYHEEYFKDPATREGLPEAVKDHYEVGELRATFPFFDNHISGGVRPPLIQDHDASGVISSTLGHHSKPYPNIKLYLEDGVVTKIDGGGERGDRLRDLLEQTRDIQYPDFPDKGLFWWFECAIGTNPKVFRPTEFMMKSQPGTLVERLRSGIIHLGTGTSASNYSEEWANEQSIPYGHVDHHLNFPTYEIDTGDEQVTLIEKGHLVALDDVEVREVAEKYGDPDEILSIDWVPELPGINMEGSYEEYAKDPAHFLSNIEQ